MKFINAFFLIFLFSAMSCDNDKGAATCIYEHILSTNEALNITDSSADLIGSVMIASENCSVPGGGQKGFVYGTSSMPDINDAIANSEGTLISTTINGLSPETTYYVRSFISSPLGEYYGNELSFITTSD